MERARRPFCPRSRQRLELSRKMRTSLQFHRQSASKAMAEQVPSSREVSRMERLRGQAQRVTADRAHGFELRHTQRWHQSEKPVSRRAPICNHILRADRADEVARYLPWINLDTRERGAKVSSVRSNQKLETTEDGCLLYCQAVMSRVL